MVAYDGSSNAVIGHITAHKYSAARRWDQQQTTAVGLSQQTWTGRSTNSISADRCRQRRRQQVPVEIIQLSSWIGRFEEPEIKALPRSAALTPLPATVTVAPPTVSNFSQNKPTSFFTFACFQPGRLANSSRFIPTTSFTRSIIKSCRAGFKNVT